MLTMKQKTDLLSLAMMLPSAQGRLREQFRNILLTRYPRNYSQVTLMMVIILQQHLETRGNWNFIRNLAVLPFLAPLKMR